MRQHDNSTGELQLPVCPQCKTVQYPLREICKNCLHHKLEWQEVSPNGQLLAASQLHTSLENFFKEHPPWPIGMVKLDCGPVMLVHLSKALTKPGQRLRVISKRDKSGQQVFIAIPESGDEAEYMQQFEVLLVNK